MESTKKYNKNISKIILILFLFYLCFLNTTVLAVEENNKITVKKSSKIEKTQKTEEKEKLDDSKENAIENNKNDTKIETKTKETQDEAKKIEEEKPKTENTDNTKNDEIEKEKESKNTQNAQNTKSLNTNNTSNENDANSEGNNINNENTNQAFEAKLNEIIFKRSGANDYIIGNISTNKKFEDVTIVVRDIKNKKELETWKSNIGSGKIYFDRNITGYVGEYEIVAKYGKEEKILELVNAKNESNTYYTIEVKKLNKSSFETSKIERKIKVSVKDITIKKIGDMDYLTANLYVKDYNIGYNIYLKNIKDGKMLETWTLKNGTDCYFDKNITEFTGEFEIIIKTSDGKEYYIPLNNLKNDNDFNTFILSKNEKTFVLKPFAKELVAETRDITFKNVNSLDYIIGNVKIFNRIGKKEYSPGKIKIILRNINDKSVKETWVLNKGHNEYYFDINLTKNYGKFEIVAVNVDTNEEIVLDLKNVYNTKTFYTLSVELLNQKQFELTKSKKEIFGSVNYGKFTSTENADYFIGNINAYNVFKGNKTKLNNCTFVLKEVNTKKEYVMFSIDQGNNNYYVDCYLGMIPTGNYNIIAKAEGIESEIINSNIGIEDLQTMNVRKMENGYIIKRKSEDLQVFLKTSKFKVLDGRDYIQGNAEVYILNNGIRSSAKDKFDIGIKNLRTGGIQRGYVNNIKDDIYYYDINIKYASEDRYALIAINRENNKEIYLNIRYDKGFIFLENNKIYDIKGSNFSIKRLKPYTLNITNHWAHHNNFTFEYGRPITEITIHHMAMVASAEKCGRGFQNPNRAASSNYGIGVNGEIARYVADTDISWANANWESNKRAVTIEVSDCAIGGNWPVSNASMNSLIELVAQIARRYDINLVKGVTLTWHRMYYNTNCPGPYLLEHMDYIVEEARKRV